MASLQDLNTALTPLRPLGRWHPGAVHRAVLKSQLLKEEGELEEPETLGDTDRPCRKSSTFPERRLVVLVSRGSVIIQQRHIRSKSKVNVMFLVRDM